jgi:NAD(P)-dependent dehydrogenase (short-subunit alcohol dehydrogenase family)
MRECRQKPYLAFDFGAQSGRAVLAHLQSGILTTEEVHRFANEPVEYGGTLHWDVPRLWFEVRNALSRLGEVELAGIGVDAWGVDYALLGERGELLQNPYHYRDRRTEGIMDEVLGRVTKKEIYEVCPLFLPWDAAKENVSVLKARIQAQAVEYRASYQNYYNAWATSDSPKLRDSNPSVVVVPGLGLFGFGKNKKEARFTTEFFINAIHVMAGANALEDGEIPQTLPQARQPGQSQQFTQFHNYVALPRSEAFRIEYWALEEAKLQRMPAEAEFSRKIALIIGGASGIGREVALLLARKGAHIVVADFDQQGAKRVADEAGAIASPEFVSHARVDLSSAASLAEVANFTISQFGGLDIIVNTAAIYPVPGADGELADAQWAQTFLVNVTGNHLLARQTEWVFEDQGLPAAMVLTSSANAVVPKKGSEAYDTSKTALNHLIRELSIKLGPHVRVNGIDPATVVAGSTMFPRDRVIQGLRKYKISFSESESTEELRAKLADFYAQRTLTKRPILPQDCAAAIVWLAGDQSAKTTGHVIPVDGGLSGAFLR